MIWSPSKEPALFPDPAEDLESLIRDPDREEAGQAFGLLFIQLSDQPEEIRLCIDRALTLRARRVLTENGFIHIVDNLLDAWLLAETDPELQRIDDQDDAIKRAHGLSEDDSWPKGGRPPESQALSTAWEARLMAVRLQRLREVGCADIAEMRENDPDDLDRRYQQGKVELWTLDDIAREELSDLRRARHEVDDACSRLRGLVAENKGAKGRRDFESIRRTIGEHPDKLLVWTKAVLTWRYRRFPKKDALLHLVMMLVDNPWVLDEDRDPELGRLSAALTDQRFREAARAHWSDKSTWKEFVALGDAREARATTLLIRQLRELGFPDIADLLESDPDELQRRMTAGEAELGWEGLDEDPEFNPYEGMTGLENII